jgi:hypothetical protein
MPLLMLSRIFCKPSIDTQYLFAPIGRTLKDSYVASFEDVEPSARLTFAEHALARRIIAQHSTLREETQFVSPPAQRRLGLSRASVQLQQWAPARGLLYRRVEGRASVRQSN